MATAAPAAEPLVTVGVLTYRHAETIEATLASVVAQEYRNLEILVADDASPDATVERVRRFAARCERPIRVLAGDRNLGVSGNINRLLAAANGKYFAGVGGDDLFFPGKVKAQVEFLEANPQASACYHDVAAFLEDPARPAFLFDGKGHPSPLTPRDLLRRGNLVPPSGEMLRRSMLPARIPASIAWTGDWYLMIEAARAGPILHLPGTYGAYRLNPQSVMGTGRGREDPYLVVAWVEAHHPEHLADARRARARLLAADCSQNLVRGERRAARAYARAALRQRKLWPPGQGALLAATALGLPTGAAVRWWRRRLGARSRGAP